MLTRAVTTCFHWPWGDFAHGSVAVRVIKMKSLGFILALGVASPDSCKPGPPAQGGAALSGLSIGQDHPHMATDESDLHSAPSSQGLSTVWS